ncbi:hypothetical protein N7G274_001776 [Stereocaulon virgatum]|uniref:DUF7707 domain-containing protein n=1 Tax=Stereocaulon virgatum TaxID=373712 RepID=A0ABR4ALD8_9LECA
MLSISLLFTSLLAGFAIAQNSTSSLDPNSVDPTIRNQWCQGEQINCPTLCGGKAFTSMNSCSGADLTYNCTCTNGTGPSNIDQYSDTLPNSICNQVFANCVKANPNSSNQCVKCGTLKASDVPAGTSSTSSSAVSTTATASSAPASSGKPNHAVGQKEGRIGGVAAGVIAAAALVL